MAGGSDNSRVPSALGKVIFPEDVPEKWSLQQPLLLKLGSCSTLEEAWDILTSIYCITKGSNPEKINKINKTPFAGLEKFFTTLKNKEVENCFTTKILPILSTLAVEVKSLLPHNGLQILRQQDFDNVALSRRCVAGIVATGFLNLFPEHSLKHIEVDSDYEEPLIPGINFDRFFRLCYASFQKAKLECILHYFEKIADSECDLPGKVIFKRVVLQDLLELSSLIESTTQLCPLIVFPDGKIEDAGCHVLQVDFANEYLGGGVLEEGNVQEEIRFSICPELLAGMLFIECMAPNESIIIQGFEQFSDYKGYGGKFRFAGDFNDQSERDGNGNIATEICAIDAVPYVWSLQSKDQYEPPHLKRDLNKAYVGFMQPDAPKWLEDELMAQKDNSSAWYLHLDPGRKRVVATGNWGCGVFGGNPQLKSLLQWVAASSAFCPALLYYSFGNQDLHGLEDLVSKVLMKGWTVGQLVKVLIKASELKKSNVFDQIITHGQL